MDGFTYRGWFGVCPVYLGDLNTEYPRVMERHWVFLPLFWISLYCAYAKFGLMSMVDADYEPGFTFRITGRL